MCVQVVLSLSPKGQTPPSATEEDEQECAVRVGRMDRKLLARYVSTHIVPSRRDEEAGHRRRCSAASERIAHVAARAAPHGR
jgi:hypothetical protein